MNMDEQLPDGWTLAKIGEIADVMGGSTPLRSEKHYFGGDIVWLTPTEIPKNTVSLIFDSKEKITQRGFDESGVRWISAGSVLLTSRASIGYVAIAGTKLTTNQGFASFVLPEEINPFYLGWWLKSQKTTLEEMATGTTFKEISKAVLKEIFLPLPPAKEQTRIVAAIEQQFTRIDAAVASLESARSKTKQYRASLLKAAVEGELTREWREQQPEGETGAQLLARILAERRARWEERQLTRMEEPPKNDKWKEAYKEPQEPDVKNLPELPEGWYWATVEQLAARSEYGTSVKCDYTAPGVPVLRIPNIAAGIINLDDMKYTIQPLNVDKDNSLQVGDVLICRTNGSLNLIGKAALVKLPLEPFHSFASYLLRFRLFETNTLPRWFHLFVGSYQGRAFIEANSPSSAGQHNISLSLLHSMPIPLPPLAEQAQIVAEVEARLSELAQMEVTIEHNLRRAVHERQSILREAFAGRLVKQEPGDEPASILLERIREERKRREEIEKLRRKDVAMDIAKKRRTKKDGVGKQGIDLYGTLVEAGQPLEPDDLFRRAGLKTEEQPESVGVFYKELKVDIADGLIQAEWPEGKQGAVKLRALELQADVTEESQAEH